MRTTVVLDDDVYAAVVALRRERSIGVSAAINELVRAGLRAAAGKSRREFRQRSAALGLRIDVSNVAEALEALAVSGSACRVSP